MLKRRASYFRLLSVSRWLKSGTPRRDREHKSAWATPMLSGSPSRRLHSRPQKGYRDRRNMAVWTNAAGRLATTERFFRIGVHEQPNKLAVGVHPRKIRTRSRYAICTQNRTRQSALLFSAKLLEHGVVKVLDEPLFKGNLQ